jgi:hypothetical protein
MSATQVIDEIQNLPRKEQEVIISFVRQLEQTLQKKDVSEENTFETSLKWAVEEHRELLRRLAQ